jgi:plastocyanin domain-containing protein
MRRPLLLSLVVALLVVPASFVHAADAPAEITLTIEKNRFDPEEIKVKSGAPFVLVISNRDGAPEEFESRDLRIEKVIPAGKTVRLRMPALKAGTYGFVGEYHEKTAKGRIVAE